MDFCTLEIRNFLTIGSADLDLESRGLVLIQGENQDDTSAKSNGSGKSSLVDALCWCLHGMTARGESGDAIVNETTNKDCYVSTTLVDGGVNYMIERYRKHSKHKNQLFVWQTYTMGSPAVPLHKGTERETQLVVDKILGCSYEVFKGAIYAGQEQMPNLPGMTDKQLKLIVEEAAGVEVLADAHTRAQRMALDADKALAVAIGSHAGMVTALAGCQAAVDEAIEQTQIFNDTRKDRARMELAKVSPLMAHVAALAASMASRDESALQARKVVLEAELASHSGQQTRRDTLQNAANDAIRSRDLLVARLQSTKSRLDHYKAQLATVASRVGTPCSECAKPYCEHDIAAAKTLCERNVANEQSVFDTYLAEARLAKKKAEDEIAIATAFKTTMTDVSGVTAELATINAALRAHAEELIQSKHYAENIEQLKENARLKLVEPNPWAAMDASRRTALDAAEQRMVDAQAKVQVLEERAELLAAAVKVFGPSGVRAHILDTVTPFLNERTSEYLGVLADGNIHASWNTLTKSAKGEMKEKFNIEVTNDKGGKSFGLQSGGEKRKVRLATALALQDMVASRATKPINLFLADEIDDALDEPGLERLMTVLDKKAKERGTVLVISHNPLKDWIDTVVTVTKSGGLSTVSGANVGGF